MGLNISAGDVVALQHDLLGQDGAHPGWHLDVGVMMLASAAALFVVAGVIRLARWRLMGDPHSALVGSALIVVGALGLPLVGIGTVAGALHHRVLADAAVRTLASAITVALVIRSVRITSVRAFDRPTILLPLLATPVLATFVGLAAVEASLDGPVPAGTQIAHVLSAAMVLGWLGLALTVRKRTPSQPWSRRAVPLFCGFAVAEGLYGAQVGNGLGTAVSLVVCTTVAVLCVRSANLDLGAGLEQTEHTIGSLSRTLLDARGQAVELSEWRASLVHDASNSVAGLQAALGVLDDRQAEADPSTARLYRAAADEVRHLDHLLHRSPGEPCRPFDVGALVRSIGDSASLLGADISVHAESVVAVGRPGDVVAVLKNLLVNACRHAAGSSVELSVESTDGLIRIVCSDNGPGLDEATARRAFDRGFRGSTSEGSGLGLHDARELMRGQGGDLVLDIGCQGARFVATLAAPAGTAGRIPLQRTASPSIHELDVHAGSTP